MEAARLPARQAGALVIAAITGSVNLAGGGVGCPGQRALAVQRAVIGGRLDGRGLRVEGETRMDNARIGASLGLVAATLDNPGGVALNAGGLTVDGGVFLTGGFSAAGEMRLIGAQLAANLSLDGAALSNPGGLALDLRRATVGTCHAPGATCTGQVSSSGARITGDLNLSEAQLTGNPGDPALVAEHTCIDGALILVGARARGEVSLRTIHVGQRVC